MSQIAQELRSPLRSRELIQRTSGIAQKLIPASTNPSCEAPRANRQCSNIKDIFAPIHSQALSLRSRGKSHDLVLDELILDPWPFRETSLAVRAEGKRLHGHFSTQEDLLRALEEAEPVRVTA